MVPTENIYSIIFAGKYNLCAMVRWNTWHLELSLPLCEVLVQWRDQFIFFKYKFILIGG